MSLDPYTDWLKIPEDRRPPSHYDLLGLGPFEQDPHRIYAAYFSRVDLVRKYQIGQYEGEALSLLSKLAEAYGCLSDPAKKADYDRRLASHRGTVPPTSQFPASQPEASRQESGPSSRSPYPSRPDSTSPDKRALPDELTAAPETGFDLLARVLEQDGDFSKEKRPTRTDVLGRERDKHLVRESARVRPGESLPSRSGRAVPVSPGLRSKPRPGQIQSFVYSLKDAFAGLFTGAGSSVVPSLLAVAVLLFMFFLYWISIGELGTPADRRYSRRPPGRRSPTARVSEPSSSQSVAEGTQSPTTASAGTPKTAKPTDLPTPDSEPVPGPLVPSERTVGDAVSRGSNKTGNTDKGTPSSSAPVSSVPLPKGPIIDDTDPRVKASVIRAVTFLKNRGPSKKVGELALMTHALAKTRMKYPDVLAAEDPAFKNLTAHLRQYCQGTFRPSHSGGYDNYEAACTISALVAADCQAYSGEIDTVCQYLLSKQSPNGAWNYQTVPGGDTSMTHMSIHALWEASGTASASVPNEVWEKAARWLVTRQTPSGGFLYHPEDPASGGRQPTHTMTVGALGALHICMDRLALKNASKTSAKKPSTRPSPKTLPTEVTVTRSLITDSIKKANTWFTRNFTLDKPGGEADNSGDRWLYYYLYALERLGTLADSDRVGGVDWYSKGAEILLAKQQSTGEWRGTQVAEGPEIETSFAALFLLRSTVLSKQMHQGLAASSPAHDSDAPTAASNESDAKSEKSATPEASKKSAQRPNAAIVGWIIPTSVDGIMSTAPATVIRRYGRALTADQRPLISIADDQMLEEAVYHLFKIPARGPVTVEWVGKVVTRSAGQVGVRLTLWDGKGWKDVGQDNTYIRGPLQVQAKPASGDRELYLLVNCTSSTGTVATDYIGVIQPDTGK